MKLYELIIERTRPIQALKACEYFTASGAAKARVTAIKKMLDGAGLRAQLSAVTLRTSLVAADWIKLLEADAPGDRCELTPVDLITDRKELRRWVIEGKPREEI